MIQNLYYISLTRKFLPLWLVAQAGTSESIPQETVDPDRLTRCYQTLNVRLGSFSTAPTTMWQPTRI